MSSYLKNKLGLSFTISLPLSLHLVYIWSRVVKLHIHLFLLVFDIIEKRNTLLTSTLWSSDRRTYEQNRVLQVRMDVDKSKS